MSKVFKDIKRLVKYGIYSELIYDEDYDYCINQLCHLLQVEFDDEDINDSYIVDEPSLLLNPLLDRAFELHLFNPNTVTQRDLFESKIMDIIQLKPSTINNDFWDLYDTFYGPLEATSYFYELSKKSNYIKTSRTNKNIRWKSNTKYGLLDMTINLSKPEKDPKDIIAQGNKTSNGYPKCLLCKETVGFYGHSSHPGRSNHRIISLKLNNEDFYLQYSPYVYYNEHCIVFMKDHTPMNVTIDTFKRLFDFVDQFPHYFLGSNAGLPIVGGSILSHEHYQGGNYKFPIEDAKILKSFTISNTRFKQLYWPLSVIRLESEDKDEIIDYAEKLYEFWAQYTNEEAGIYSHTNGTPHNAITPIARKEEDLYILDMTLRNNLTSDAFPLGIFHPHPENHHIKKENIGLIEVMGLSVLPARLKTELETIKNALVNKDTLPQELDIHRSWFNELQKVYNGEDINDFINNQVTIKFMKCIEDSGVFKQTDVGIKLFDKFIKEFENALN